MKVLLTAFDPFGGEAINPALEAVKMVRPMLGAIEVVKLEVPTVFGKSIERVREVIEEIDPDVVLCVGQAGGRFGITVERVAINIDENADIIILLDAGLIQGISIPSVQKYHLIIGRWEIQSVQYQVNRHSL